MDTLFFFKKLITPIFYPLTVIVLLLLGGLALLRRKTGQTAGLMLAGAGLTLTLLSSFTITSDILVAYLERQYPPLASASSLPAEVTTIVVLGGGCSGDTSQPLSSRLAPQSLSRLIEGIRLWKSRPHATLILSGGAVFSLESEAALMARVATMLGVPEKHLRLETASLDTAEQARRIKADLSGQPFILVTSALHMPRSMFLFRNAGLAPVPAPTDFLADKERTGFSPRQVFPSAKALYHSEAAIHELLGLSWERLKKALAFG